MDKVIDEIKQKREAYLQFRWKIVYIDCMKELKTYHKTKLENTNHMYEKEWRSAFLNCVNELKRYHNKKNLELNTKQSWGEWLHFW